MVGGSWSLYKNSVIKGAKLSVFFSVDPRFWDFFVDLFLDPFFCGFLRHQFGWWWFSCPHCGSCVRGPSSGTIGSVRKRFGFEWFLRRTVGISDCIFPGSFLLAKKRHYLPTRHWWFNSRTAALAMYNNRPNRMARAQSSSCLTDWQGYKKQ